MLRTFFMTCSQKEAGVPSTSEQLLVPVGGGWEGSGSQAQLLPPEPSFLASNATPGAAPPAALLQSDRTRQNKQQPRVYRVAVPRLKRRQLCGRRRHGCCACAPQLQASPLMQLGRRLLCCSVRQVEEVNTAESEGSSSMRGGGHDGGGWSDGSAGAAAAASAGAAGRRRQICDPQARSQLPEDRYQGRTVPCCRLRAPQPGCRVGACR